MSRHVALYLLSAIAAWTQQAPSPDEPLIRVTVNLVQVDAVVTGRDGNIVTDLQPGDFEILQDGKPRKLTRFAFISTQDGAAAAPPKLNKGVIVPPPSIKPEEIRRTIVIFVDDLSLSLESTHLTRQSIRKFTASLLPGDLVALVRTSGNVLGFQNFTTDHARIAGLADNLRWNFRSRSGPTSIEAFDEMESESIVVRAKDSAGLAEELYANHRNRAAALGAIGALDWIVKGLREMPGRKSVFIISEGIHLTTLNSGGNASRAEMSTPLRRLTEAAVRAGVVFYSMDPRGLQAGTITAADNVNDPNISAAVFASRNTYLRQTQESLRALAVDTGGRSFLNTNALDGAMRAALNDQAGFYLLGYDPGDGTFDRKFHKISVKVKRKDLTVRSRSGFMGFDEKPPLPPTELTRQQHVVKALQTPFLPSAVPIKLTGLYLADEKLSAFLHCFIHVDLKRFQFTDTPDGKKHATVDALVAAFDAEGIPADYTFQSFEMEVANEKLDGLLEKGVVVSVQYPLKRPGTYQLRAAVRDPASGQAGSSSQFVVVPDLAGGKTALSSLMVGQTATPGISEAGRLSLATRSFRSGEAISYSIQILNPKALGKYTLQVRVFEDSKPFYEGGEIALDLGNLAANRRFAANGRINLDAPMKEADYSLQIIVTDSSGSKPVKLAQWTDFRLAAP